MPQSQLTRRLAYGTDWSGYRCRREACVWFWVLKRSQTETGQSSACGLLMLGQSLCISHRSNGKQLAEHQSGAGGQSDSDSLKVLLLAGHVWDQRGIRWSSAEDWLIDCTEVVKPNVHWRPSGNQWMPVGLPSTWIRFADYDQICSVTGATYNIELKVIKRLLDVSNWLVLKWRMSAYCLISNLLIWERVSELCDLGIRVSNITALMHVSLDCK